MRYIDQTTTSQIDQQINNIISNNTTHNLSTMLKDTLSNKGKQLRVDIAIGVAKAFNTEVCDVLGWAVACELFHNGTLIHDDIQDGDQIRRGKPAAWVNYGTANAINLGNLLLLGSPQAIDLIPSLSTEDKLSLYRLYSTISSKVVNGQSLEFELNLSNLEKNFNNLYIECISQKTAVLMAGIAKGVAIIAGQSTDTQNQVFDLFLNIGIIFQVQDDIIDLFGEKGRLEQGCDIKEGKISALITLLLDKAPSLANQVQSILEKPRDETTEDDIKFIMNKIKEHEVLKDLSSLIHKHIDLVHLNQIVNKNKLLKQFVDQIIEKIFKPIKHLKII